MSAIYYDQSSDIKADKCETIVMFDTLPESKILDTSDILILSNLQSLGQLFVKMSIEHLNLNIQHTIYLTGMSYVNAP